MSKKKFKQKKKKNKDFSRDILVILQKNSGKSFSWKQIAEKLKATSTEMRNDIIASLARLVKQSDQPRPLPSARCYLLSPRSSGYGFQW